MNKIYFGYLLALDETESFSAHTVLLEALSVLCR